MPQAGVGKGPGRLCTMCKQRGSQEWIWVLKRDCAECILDWIPGAGNGHYWGKWGNLNEVCTTQRANFLVSTRRCGERFLARDALGSDYGTLPIEDRFLPGH